MVGMEEIALPEVVGMSAKQTHNPFSYDSSLSPISLKKEKNSSTLENSLTNWPCQGYV